MNDVANPAADNSETAEVNPGALHHPAPLPEVDPRAIRTPEPKPDVDAEALTRTPEVRPPDRRRLVLGSLAAVVVLALVGGGFWWRHEVTANPGLEFSGGLNVYRDATLTDMSGIVRRDSPWSSDVEEVEVAFISDSRLYAMVGLYNGGAHDVRIDAALPGTMYSWGFDRMSLSTGPYGSYNGEWEPFRPFTLRRGETRQVRLEFRLADCDPAPQSGAYSVLRELRLRYHLLGVGRTAGVSFPDETIALETGGECKNLVVE
jgi:hypothetical protein